MQSSETRRGNISESAADVVRAMIVDGRLAAGERINEVRLAERLGVSRTPLREALSGLVAEGALIARPRLGYFVQPLSLDDFEQIYAIRPLLDPEALRLAGIPSAKRLAKLTRLNAELSKAKGLRAIDLDDAWHLELISACPNKVLIELIQNIMVRTRRYELALMGDNASVGGACEEHENILRSLTRGHVDAACAALARNLQNGREPIAVWLKQRAARIAV